MSLALGIVGIAIYCRDIYWVRTSLEVGGCSKHSKMAKSVFSIKFLPEHSSFRPTGHIVSEYVQVQHLHFW